MSRKPQQPKPIEDPAEYRRFIEAARSLEADENPNALDRAFEKIIRTPLKGQGQSATAPPRGSTHRQED